ncbi:MAG: protein kinase [Ardenticatenia bacterium]|nr:protein kinase [Ardenticatenia bacterium]
MGAVYSARDQRFRAAPRRCAVKEMFNTLLDPAARRQAVESFEREANILASLNHPAIPKVFDYFSEHDRHYLVLEYIEGQDLGRYIAQRARPSRQPRQWTGESSSAMCWNTSTITRPPSSSAT